MGVSGSYVPNAIGAIYLGDKAANGPLSTALPGGMHHERAAEGKATQRPYCVYEVMDTPSKSSFGTRTSDYAVRFLVNGDTDTSAAAAIQAVCDKFADALLPRQLVAGETVASNTETYYMHEPKPVPLPDGVNEVGADPWQYIVTLVFCCRFV